MQINDGGTALREAHISADFKSFREDCSNSLDHCISQLFSFTKFDAHFNKIKLQEWRGHRWKRPV